MDLEAALQPATPPTIVLEQPAPCAETAETASQEFASALPVTTGDPLAGWSVHVRVMSVGHEASPSLRADGEILDGRGISISRRSFTNPGTMCAPLAKAIGVWASLALDDERAKLGPDAKPPAPPAGDASHAKHKGHGFDEEDDVDPDLQPNRPPPEEHTRELGVASVLEGGVADRPLFGPAVYGVMDLGAGFLLRPTIAFDATFASQQTIHGATRIDICGRLRGNYHAQRGLDAEICAGSEMGFLRESGTTLPLLALGPALGLQGELASNFAVTLRGIGNINLLGGSIGEFSPQTLAGRVELGVTWKLQ